VLGLALTGAVSTSYAGPFILAGTDADDHGSVSGGVNQDGWFFMQRALENLAPNVTNGNKQLVILGSNVGTKAELAALSAFNLSSLKLVNGWTVTTVNDAALNTFLDGGLVGAGIVIMDSGSNVSGGATATERGYFTTHAAKINSFLGAGGGLFSQANGYAWVQALVPGLTVTGLQTTGLALTADGNAAFPGLTNADLSAGPWHNYFTNTGNLPILATSSTLSTPRAVILGAVGGSITNPNLDPDPQGVPDSGSFLIAYLALGALFFASRRHAVKRVA